jgi:hypothetical protein
MKRKWLVSQLVMWCIMATVLEGAVVVFAACQTKCRSGSYFTTDGLDRWAVTDLINPPNILECRRIWRTDDPEDDIVDGIKLVRRRRELGGFAQCDIVCNANGGVFGLVDCTHPGLTFGDPEEFDCWAECIEEPSP